MTSLTLKTASIALLVGAAAFFARKTVLGAFPPLLFWICLALALWVPVAANHGLSRSDRALGIRRLPTGCILAIVALLLAFPVSVVLTMYAVFTVSRF